MIVAMVVVVGSLGSSLLASDCCASLAKAVLVLLCACPGFLPSIWDGSAVRDRLGDFKALSFDDLAMTKRGNGRNIEGRNGKGGNRRRWTCSLTRKIHKKKIED